MTTTAKPRAAGHEAHTKAADQKTPLPGRFDRPIKVAMMGAGSAFTPRLMNDILQIESADRGEIALVDIDEQRLNTMHQLVTKLVEKHGRSEGWSVTATTDRREALPGTTYLVSCVEVSGTACVKYDNDIPLKYGIDQCIGDTIGPGGLFKSLRTIPVWLDILRDAEELCPEALVLNYTNPMNMMCLASGRTSSMQMVGLCHSVQGTSHLLARYADVPYEELHWNCAGINHLAWFTTLEHKGQDLYTTKLYEQFRREVEQGIREAEQGKARYDSTDPTHGNEVEKPYEYEDLVRKDMCVHFGAFITESSGHLSEYLPYYRKSEAGRNLLRMGYHGGSRFYATNWPEWRKKADEQRMKMVENNELMDWPRSWEYASWIIEAREKDSPFRIYGNFMNNHRNGLLINNLLHDGCVEVACMIDRNGFNPVVYGNLPPQMAAICRSNQSMFDLGATAAIEKSKEAAVHALMLDPLTAAVCTPSEIRAMTMELFEAEAEFLPGYR